MTGSAHHRPILRDGSLYLPSRPGPVRPHDLPAGGRAGIGRAVRDMARRLWSIRNRARQTGWRNNPGSRPSSRDAGQHFLFVVHRQKIVGEKWMLLGFW